jgi:uncharacterized protein
MGQQQRTEPEAEPKPSPGQTDQPKAAVSDQTADLIRRAGQTFTEYQRLTSEGKLGEAGQKLDELKGILDQLQRARP